MILNRRISVLLLAAMMLLSLTACGSKKPGRGSTTGSTTVKPGEATSTIQVVNNEAPTEDVMPGIDFSLANFDERYSGMALEDFIAYTEQLGTEYVLLDENTAEAYGFNPENYRENKSVIWREPVIVAHFSKDKLVGLELHRIFNQDNVEFLNETYKWEKELDYSYTVSRQNDYYYASVRGLEEYWTLTGFYFYDNELSYSPEQPIDYDNLYELLWEKENAAFIGILHPGNLYVVSTTIPHEGLLSDRFDNITEEIADFRENQEYREFFNSFNVEDFLAVNAK